MIEDKKLEEWGYTLEKHSHYNPKTQAAVRNFQRNWGTFQSLKKTDWNAAMYWADQSQQAWNIMARCRIEETGNPFYLTPEQYQEAVRELAR